MYIQNRRDNSKFKGCSPLQLHLGLMLRQVNLMQDLKFLQQYTDDQGVFNTYLENEYALMALALEKAKDKNGNPKYKPTMIYDWLERVRQMGVEMSFKNLQIKR